MVRKDSLDFNYTDIMWCDDWLDNWIKCNKKKANKWATDLELIVRSKICDQYFECPPMELSLFMRHALESKIRSVENWCLEGWKGRRIKSQKIKDVSLTYEYDDCTECIDWYGYPINPKYLDLIECYCKSDEPILVGRYCANVNTCRTKKRCR